MTGVIPGQPLKGPSEASFLECLKYHSPPQLRPQDGLSKIPPELPGNDLSAPHSLHRAVESHFTGNVDSYSDLGVSGSSKMLPFARKTLTFFLKPYNNIPIKFFKAI